MLADSHRLPQQPFWQLGHGGALGAESASPLRWICLFRDPQPAHLRLGQSPTKSALGTRVRHGSNCGHGWPALHERADVPRRVWGV